MLVERGVGLFAEGVLRGLALGLGRSGVGGSGGELGLSNGSEGENKQYSQENAVQGAYPRG